MLASLLHVQMSHSLFYHCPIKIALDKVLDKGCKFLCKHHTLNTIIMGSGWGTFKSKCQMIRKQEKLIYSTTVFSHWILNYETYVEAIKKSYGKSLHVSQTICQGIRETAPIFTREERMSRFEILYVTIIKGSVKMQSWKCTLLLGKWGESHYKIISYISFQAITENARSTLKSVTSFGIIFKTTTTQVRFSVLKCSGMLASLRFV